MVPQSINKIPSPETRKAAVEKLNDQVAFADIIRNDKSAYIRKIAVGKLNDHSLLKKVSKNDSS